MFGLLKNRNPLDKVYSLIERGLFEKALSQLNKLFNRDENDSEIYYLRGRCFLQLGSEDEALSDLIKCIELNFESYEWLSNPELKKLFKDHYSGQLENLNDRLKNSNDPDLYEERGFIKLLINKTVDGALKDFTKSIEQHSTNYKLYFYRSFLSKDIVQNISDLTQVIETQPNNSYIYFLRAQKKRIQQNSKGALDDYDQAILLNPNNSEPYHERGIVKAQRNELESALLDLNNAIRLAPNNGNYYNTRAVAIYSQIGRIKDAELDLKRAKILGHDLAGSNLPELKNRYEIENT